MDEILFERGISLSQALIELQSFLIELYFELVLALNDVLAFEHISNFLFEVVSEADAFLLEVKR